MKNTPEKVWREAEEVEKRSRGDGGEREERGGGGHGHEGPRSSALSHRPRCTDTLLSGHSSSRHLTSSIRLPPRHRVTTAVGRSRPQPCPHQQSTLPLNQRHGSNADAQRSLYLSVSQLANQASTRNITPSLEFGEIFGDWKNKPMVFPRPAHVCSLVVARHVSGRQSRARTRRLADRVLVRHGPRIATRAPEMAVWGPQLPVTLHKVSVSTWQQPRTNNSSASPPSLIE